jgi:hypothetical protein
MRGGGSRTALRRALPSSATWHPIGRSPEELRAGMPEIRLCRASARPMPRRLPLRNDVRGRRHRARSPPRSVHAARVNQIGKLSRCGIAHLVLEFVAGVGADLERQPARFAARVHPRLG